MKTSSRALICAVSATLVLSGCGSSADEGADEPTELTNEAPPEALDDAGATTTAESAAEPEPAPEPEESADASVVRVSGGPAGEWSLPAVCEWNPENDGPASITYSIKDTDEEQTEDVDVFEAWPIQIEEGDVPILFGFVTNPEDQLLVLIDAEASSDGTTLTVVANVHEGLKTFDDPPDHVMTFTCGP